MTFTAIARRDYIHSTLNSPIFKEGCEYEATVETYPEADQNGELKLNTIITIWADPMQVTEFDDNCIVFHSLTTASDPFFFKE